ncbi:hypothetical protein [Psychroflexus aestuariivivens]|uniref:hypothetical protein n=1 Tax=Psychroflexus aestuariivivens TaxID=1795040 RepID=UPI000FDA6179|nr:hypothetical protein [Psychroflexus aestuariivivens]
MKYKIRTISVTLFVFTFITILLSFSYVAYNFKEVIDIKAYEFIVFITATLLIIGIYWISVKLTSGIAEIELTKREIEFNWLKKPILKSQDNLKFDLYKIDSWNIQREFHYDTLNISSNFSSMTISRFPEWRDDKDDYQSFINSFSNKIKSINKKKLKSDKRNEKPNQTTENKLISNK